MAECQQVKMKFLDMASYLKKGHLEDHPGYQYRPRRPSQRRRRMTPRKAALLQSLAGAYVTPSPNHDLADVHFPQLADPGSELVLPPGRGFKDLCTGKDIFEDNDTVNPILPLFHGNRATGNFEIVLGSSEYNVPTLRAMLNRALVPPPTLPGVPVQTHLNALAPGLGSVQQPVNGAQLQLGPNVAQPIVNSALQIGAGHGQANHNGQPGPPLPPGQVFNPNPANLPTHFTRDLADYACEDPDNTMEALFLTTASAWDKYEGEYNHRNWFNNPVGQHDLDTFDFNSI